MKVIRFNDFQEVTRFEHELARLTVLRYAVSCASGLNALEIALRATGLQPGDQVITIPLSAFAFTLAIARAGDVPVFLNVDRSGLLNRELSQE